MSTPGATNPGFRSKFPGAGPRDEKGPSSLFVKPRP